MHNQQNNLNALPQTQQQMQPQMQQQIFFQMQQQMQPQISVITTSSRYTYAPT